MGQRTTTSIREGERADHTRGCLSLLQYKQQNKNYGRRVTGRAWSVLTQLHGSEWRLIGYSSRRLSDVERRYSQTEKEALALVWACERFNMYVSGREFELERIISLSSTSIRRNRSLLPCGKMDPSLTNLPL